MGLFGKSDLNDMSKETLFAKDNLIARSLNKTRIFGENSRISKTANKFDDWISDIYQGEDNIMRYVAFASHYNYTNEIRQQKWKIWTNIGPNFMKSYRKLYKSSNKKYFFINCAFVKWHKSLFVSLIKKATFIECYKLLVDEI